MVSAPHDTFGDRPLRRAPLYSEELGIALARGTERECFKWFLASLLFGARIGETIAKNTYRAFERHGLLSPRAIVDAGWAFLVNPIMREGGYVRYDGRKSTQILRDCERLLDEYGGRITEVHARARDARDLERRLQEFYGVGPVTTNIFLRELRPFWAKADPEPLPRVLAAARARHVALRSRPRKSLSFARLEAALIRTRGRARRQARDDVRTRRSGGQVSRRERNVAALSPSGRVGSSTTRSDAGSSVTGSKRSQNASKISSRPS